MAKLMKSKNLIDNERWVAAGRWVQVNRENNGIKVKTAAEIAGVTPRHWSRYEKGETPMPREKVTAIAAAIAMPPGRLLLHAGYEDSDHDIDPETELRWIWTYLLRGNLAAAVERIFHLHVLIDGEGKALAQPVESITCDAFVTAVQAVYRLPRWLCTDLIKHLKKRQKESYEHDAHVKEGRREKIRKKIKEKLSKPIQLRGAHFIEIDGERVQLGASHTILIPPEKRRRK